MKQTNNAIKFLMAQYRAIFKNAYFKGIASAVLLTAGLAAGQAQAADTLLDATAWATLPAEVNVSGKDGSTAPEYTKITITETKNNQNTTTINITASEAASASTIGSSTNAAAVNVSGANTTINFLQSGTNAAKLTVEGKDASNATTFDVKAINITKGELAVAGFGTVSADTISLQAADAANRANAKISFTGADATKANSLVGKLTTANAGGTLDFTGGFGTIKTYTGEAGADLDVIVADGKGSVLDLSVDVDNGGVETSENQLFKINNGTFDLKNSATTNSGATFTINHGILELSDNVILTSSGSNTQGVGTIKVNNTVSNAASGDNSVAGAVLRMSSKQLQSFLSGDKGIDGSLTTADQAGSIQLTKGTLELTDTGNVDLFEVFGSDGIAVNSSNANGVASKVEVGTALGNSVIKGKEFSITDSLGTAASKLVVQADKITLTEKDNGLGVGETVAEKYVLTLDSTDSGDGKDAYTVDQVHSYAAVLEDQANPFYSATNADTKDYETVDLAGTGTIDSNLIVSGASAKVNVYAGHYTDTHDITLNSGSLTVGGQATGSEYEGIDASLTLTGTLKLDNSNNGNTITVAGNSGDVTFGQNNYKRLATAVLDLTGAGLTIKGHTSNLSQFNVNANGILRITTEQALDILNTHGDRSATTSDTKGAGILISGGRVEVAGDLYDRDATIKGILVTKLASGDDANVATDTIEFSGAGSTLAADSITLYSTNVDLQTLDIGAGELEADSITLNQNALDSTTHRPLDFNVKSGVLNVGESLDGSANQIVLGDAGSSSAEVNLGYITKDVDPTHGIYADLTTYTTSADTGSVNVDLKLEGEEAYVTGQDKDTSDLNIVYGAWTVQDIDATNANITVGQASSNQKHDIDGNVYTTSLTGQGLTLGTGTQMTVNSNGAATFETLALKGGNVTVENTTLTINGDYQAEVKDDPTTNGVNEAKPESWGLETSAGTINVTGRKGQLILGAEAVQGVTTKLNDGKYVYRNANDGQSAFVTLSGYATLALGLSSDVTFDATSLQELRKDFIFGNTQGTVLTDGFIDIGDATIEGIDPSTGTISWNGQNGAPGLKDYSDIIADILQNDLRNAVLVDVGAGDTVQANVGAIVVDGSANSVRLNDTNLYNAAANNGNFFSNEDTTGPIDAIVEDGAHVSLNNGGNTGAIQLSNGTTGTTELAVVSSAVESATAPVTTIENLRGLGDNTSFEVSGVTNITRNLEIGTLEVNDALTVNGTTTISNGLTSREDADGNLVTTGSLNTVSALTVEGGVDYAGNITASGTASFGAANGNDRDLLGNLNEYYFAGNNTFKDVTLYNGAEFDRGVTTAETMTIGSGMEIYGGASVKADVLQFTTAPVNTGNNWISVGEPAGEDKATGEKWESSNGYLTVGRLDLAGNNLVTDPDWSKPASIVAIGQLGSATAVTSALGNDAGTLDGSLVALQNSILAIGVTDSTETDGDTAIEQIQQTFATYLNDKGALSEDGVGAIAYVAKAMDLGADDKIVVDALRNAKQYQDLMDGTNTNPSAADTAFKTAVNGNNAYIGANSVLAFGNAALNATRTDGTTTTDRAALHFDVNSASIFGAGGKIVLTGGEFNTIDEVLLFTDNGTGEHNGITIAADGQDIRVESLSGLYYMTLEAGTETTGGELMLNHSRLNEVFTSASTPVKNSLVAYAERNNNWADGNAEVDRLVGDLRKDVTYNPATNTYTDANGATLDSNRFVRFEQKDANGAVTGYTVYDEADNAVLDYTVMYDASGATAETTARMGAYAGVAQAALAAGASTYDSISSRMGIGAQSSTMTFAENGQGAGLWLNPIYKSHDSDGFDAEGVDYGVDRTYTVWL